MGKAKERINKEKGIIKKEPETFEPFEIIDYQHHLNIMFPKDETKILDFDTQEKDKAGHPFNFIANSDNFDEFLGFKITSHPKRTDALQKFFYVKVDHPSEITYTDPSKIKDESYIHCEHIELYQDFLYNGFESKGNMEKNIYEEKMSEVLAKHVLLQEEKLATFDPNTDKLLDRLCLLREDIINSPRYQSYLNSLYGKDLTKQSDIDDRMALITAQKELVQKLEQNKAK